MELIIKPYHSHNLCIIDTNESFAESFDYEVACNNTYYFKVGFNLYAIDENYE